MRFEGTAAGGEVSLRLYDIRTVDHVSDSKIVLRSGDSFLFVIGDKLSLLLYQGNGVLITGIIREVRTNENNS